MTFDEYQIRALETDRVSELSGSSSAESVIVPLLGLAGEAGELLTEYKKQIRDGSAHTLYSDRVTEELGDLLWYLSNVASKYHISLDEVARRNLRKTRDRWMSKEVQLPFTGELLPHEAFPDSFIAELIGEDTSRGRTSKLLIDGQQIGSTLTDNAHDPDGYRFHDIFHLTYAAMLGWSPVVRALLKRKRRSNPKLDEVEDGGRAVVIEEGVAALVFAYARNHSWLDGVRELDYDLIRTVHSMTAHLEVSDRSSAEWEKAILKSFECWRYVVANNGGKFAVRFADRSINLHPQS